MIKSISINKYFLLIILLYGLFIISWNLNYSSVTHDEAMEITIGDYILKDFLNINDKVETSLLEHRIARQKMRQYMGTVLISPVLSSIGDSIGGLIGARSIRILFGLGLTVIVFLITNTLFSEKYGLIAALLFIFSSVILYLSKLATYDIISAFFLGLTFLLLIKSEDNKSQHISKTLLFTGAVALFLSAITKYISAIYILPFIFYVFLKHRLSKALFIFFLPFASMYFLYFYLYIIPVLYTLSNDFAGSYNNLRISFFAESFYHWLAMPYIFVVFGFFSKNFEKNKFILLIIFSFFIIVFLVLTGNLTSLHKDIIYSFIFLTPLAALGVDHIGSIFSRNIQSDWVKPFFIAAVLLILWVYGLYNLNWLENQHPNIKPVVSYLIEEGEQNMNVVLDSKHGDPHLIYYYSIKNIYPKAKFFSLSRQNEGEKNELLKRINPDFLILDEFFGDRNLSLATSIHIRQENYAMKNFDLSLSWGVQKVKVFKKR